MIIRTEAAGVHILGGIVRRVKIEKGVVAVIVPNKRLKVLILYHRVRQSTFKLLNQMEQLAEIERLGSERFTAARIAVSLQFKIHRRFAHVVVMRNSKAKLLELLCLKRRQHDLR